jgi:hypothetical protein
MAWRTAGRLGCGGGPLKLFFPPPCSATIWMGSRIASFSNVAGSTPIASSRCSRCIILFGS